MRITRGRHRRIIAVLVVAACAACVIAEGPRVIPSKPLPPALDRVLRDYERAWGAKDEKALAALFAEDGFVLPRGSPPIRGRASIERHYRDSGGPLSLRALAFATAGDIGYIIGAYSSKKGEPDVGKFTLTLVRDPEGRWLIMSDMDNGNRRR